MKKKCAQNKICLGFANAKGFTKKWKRLFSHLSSLHIYFVHCLLGNIPPFLMKWQSQKSSVKKKSYTENIFPDHSNGLQVRSQSSFKLHLRTTSCKQKEKRVVERFWFVTFDIKNSIAIDPLWGSHKRQSS